MNMIAMFNSLLADDCSTASTQKLEEFLVRNEKDIEALVLSLAYLTPDMKCQGCGEKLDAWHPKCSCIDLKFHTRIARLRSAALWDP